MSLVCAPVPIPLSLPLPLAFSLESVQLHPQDLHEQDLQQEQDQQRKRTSSFSLAAPAAKLQRISMTQTVPRSTGLKRTETLLNVIESSSVGGPQQHQQQQQHQQLPYYRTLQYYKDQRLKRKTDNNSTPSASVSWTPSSSVSMTNLAARKSQPSLSPLITTTTPTPTPTPTKRQPTRSSPSPTRSILPLLLPRNPHHTPRTSSPLTQSPLTPSSPSSPTPSSRPSASIPTTPTRPRPLPTPPAKQRRSRNKQDPSALLYKKAIKANMSRTPEGRRVLHMGPRLAMSIACATRELERIVNGHSLMHADEDAVMLDADGDADAEGEDEDMGRAWAGEKSAAAGCVLSLSLSMTSSWVVVKGDDRDRDWEMVDCAA